MTFVLPFIWAIKIQGIWAKVKVTIFHFLSTFMIVHINTLLQLAIPREATSCLWRIQMTTSPGNRFYSGSGLLNTRDCHSQEDGILKRNTSFSDNILLWKQEIKSGHQRRQYIADLPCNSVSYTDMYSHIPLLLKFLFLCCTTDRISFSKVYLTIL